MQNLRTSRLRRSSLHSRDGSASETLQDNKEKLKQKQKLSEDLKQAISQTRAKYIQELEERNRKLKYQIMKINQMLEQQKDTKAATKRQYKLIPNETSADVLQKQLQNVYKSIKNYQYEINNLQNKHSGGLITDKMARMEIILIQKTQHLQKLRAQLNRLSKQSIDNSKKLANNFSKQKTENILLKYNEETKILRERVRNAQDKQKKKQQNAKKQYDHIKTLEIQLLGKGVSMDEIEELKRNNIFIQIYEKMNNPDKEQTTIRQNQPDQSLSANQSKYGQKSQVKQYNEEHPTMQRYEELKNQAKLYQKLNEDYSKKLVNLQKQRQCEEKLFLQAKRKMDEKQEELSTLKNQISVLKIKMRSMSLASNYQPPPPEPIVKKQKPKMPPSKLKKNAQDMKSVTSDQTHIKFDEKGLVSQKGQRFTDRTLIGKVTNLKIVGVKVWAQKTTNQISGIQCFYRVGDSIQKWGEQHVNKQAKKYCTQNKMELTGADYVKSVSGHLSPNNIIEYLVFISNMNVIGRFGVAKPTQKQFNFDIDDDQIPISMYGSLLQTFMTIDGQKREITLLEQLGFEITSDKTEGKDAV